MRPRNGSGDMSRFIAPRAWRRTAIALSIAGAFAPVADAADPAPAGGEFKVNATSTTAPFYDGFNSNAKAVARDAAGNFMVVWERNDTIFGQRFDAAGAAQGGEFQVSALTEGFNQ